MITIDSLEVLKAKYPKTKKNQAVTGPIPIAEYYANEEDISKLCIEHQLQRFYRGPRWKDTSTRTRKADATSVVLYKKCN